MAQMTATDGARVLLIDGHGLAFRAYHALPEMTNSRGELIRVAYGYTSMLLLALSQGFECAVAAFDPPGPTFRDEKMATYKGQRKPTPQELIDQIPMLHRITKILNIPVVVVPGFEADDVLGTLSKQASEQGCETVILTGDMDLIQLVDDRTFLQTSRRGSSEPMIYDPEAVRQRYGFDPPLMIDFKALRGDASDNIPGVPGIGEKTATALIQRYGPLDQVLASVSQMPPGRTRTTLQEHADEAIFGREMVTIVRDVPGVHLDLASCRVCDYDHGAARELLEEVGMPSLVRRLPAASSAAAAVEAPTSLGATQVVDADSLPQVVQQIRRADLALLVRAVATDPGRKGRLVGMAMALDAERSWYLPLLAATPAAIVGPSLQPLLDLLADEGVAKAAYQWKDELLAVGGAGWALRGGVFDLVLASYLGDSRGRTPSLAALCEQYQAPPPPDQIKVLGKGLGRRLPEELSVEEQAQLFGGEAACAAAVRPRLAARLTELDGQRLLTDMELPVAGILAAMEAEGVRLDSSQLVTLSAEMTAQIRGLEDEMFRLAGRQFAPGSPTQLATLLYDELGLESSRRTKTGRSTDAQALEALREMHPIVPLVLEWRQVTKLKSTYVDALPTLVDPDDGRIHTSFNQAVAATGRLSSSDPNLQNIPIRSELGRRIRAAFIPGAEDWKLVSADYSQIELRVLAHLSQDPQLLAAFRRGDDVHADTAAQVFSVDRGEVTADQRRMAKVVNFGILYGLSSFGLARDLGISAKVADEFIRRYFETFSGVQEYLESVRREARSQGYVSTIMGRRRYLTDIHSSNRQLRDASERMAINMPIQGSAADLMKMGMIRTDKELQKAGLRARMLLQVHDELVFECPSEEVAAVGALARRGMETAAELAVPLVVDLKAGPNWRDLSPLALGAGGD